MLNDKDKQAVTPGESSAVTEPMQQQPEGGSAISAVQKKIGDQLGVDHKESIEDKELLLLRVGRVIQERIERAAQLKKEDLSRGINKKFDEYVKEVWPKNYPPKADRETYMFLMDDDPELNAGELSHLIMEFDEHGTYDTGYITIKTHGINDAETEGEIDDCLGKVLQTMYHELEHAYLEGTGTGGGSLEEKYAYFSHPGEMRANAKQFAFWYVRNFPNEPFNLEKMQSIANLSGSITYFIICLNPVKQEEYRQYGSLIDLHAQVAKLTEYFTDQFNSFNKVRG